jgi:hypothetical protein
MSVKLFCCKELLFINKKKEINKSNKSNAVRDITISGFDSRIVRWSIHYMLQTNSQDTSCYIYVTFSKNKSVYNNWKKYY